jgi:integrase
VENQEGGGGESRYELVRFAGDPVARARSWTDLPEDELRRRAVVACRDRDQLTLWSLTEAYFSTYGAAGGRTSPHTLRAYRQGIGQFLAFAGVSAVNLLRPARDIGPSFLRSREAAGRSPGTVRLELAAVRLLFRALRWSGATMADPFADARPAREATAPWDKRQPYSEQEVQALLEAATPQTRALILFGAHAGLRVSEALLVTWGDLNVEAQTIRVRSGKGGKARTVVMSRSLSQTVQGLPTCSRDALLFSITDMAVRKRLRVLCRQTGVPYRGYHAFRHYAGTKLYLANGNLEAVARHLGHSSLDTTRIYAKWSDERLKHSVGNW